MLRTLALCHQSLHFSIFQWTKLTDAVAFGYTDMNQWRMDSILPHDRQNHQLLNVNIGAYNAVLYVRRFRNGMFRI